MKEPYRYGIITKLRQIFFVKVFVVVVLVFSSNSLYAQGNDFETISKRIIEYNKRSSSTKSVDNNVTSSLSLYKESAYDLGSYYNKVVTGSHFSDIDYTSRSAASWPVIAHVRRVESMADAYTRTDSKYYNDADLFSKIEKLLDFWHTANVTSTNWWQQSIGVPKSMTVALLYLEYGGGNDKVNKQLVDAILNRIRGTSRTNPANEAGPNKTDMAMHWANRALIRENADTLKLAAKYAFDPMEKVSPSKEGIQYDGSYFQHGSQLQIASYGGELMNTTVAFLEFFHGTDFAITPERLEVFSEYARETYFGNMRGEYFPYTLTGRGVTRSGYTKRSGNASFARSLMNTDPTHKDKYELIAKQLEGTIHASEGISPNSRLYYIGDYISHNRSGYQYSVRTASSRTYRSEWGNDEGYETYFMSDAGSAILLDGSEYGNIYGVWDWSKVPGVTNPLLPRGEIPNSRSSMAAGTSTPGTEQFVGGVSDDLYSAYAYTLYDSWGTNNRKGNRVNINTIADKAWFMFDEEIVCLGSNLTSNATHASLGDLELITTMNQALLKGKVLVGNSSGQVEEYGLGVNKTYDNAAQWIVHNNIGYVFPKGGQVNIETATKSGAWSENNYSQSDEVVSADLYAIWLSHGKKAKNEKYVYFVVPNISDAASMQNYYDKKLKDIEIVENSDKIQAVRHKTLGIWQIIFRKPATFKHEELILKADQPSAIMVKDIDMKNGKATVYAGDVMQYGSVMKFGIDIPSMTDGLKAITIDNTTSGALKGKSIEVIFDKNTSDYVFSTTDQSTTDPLFEYSLKATADTYANELAGTKDTNYGSNNSMTTKLDANVGWSRQAFIKVPLTDLDKVENLDMYNLEISIKLYLLRTNSDMAQSSWVLKPVEDEWDENIVTWNNKPAATENILGSTSGFLYNGMLGDEFNEENVVNIDISKYAVEQYKAGKKEISLTITNGSTGSKIDADFATKEHENDAYHPRIVTKGFPKEFIAESRETTVLADAYVKNGNGQNTKYGTNKELSINTGGAGYHREIFLTYSLDQLANIDFNTYDVKANMKLYQYGSQAEANKTSWDVRAVEDTEWVESNITWNTKPNIASAVISSLPGFVNNKEVAGYNEKNIAIFDITDYALEKFSENASKISLSIKAGQSSGNSSKYASSFASKEYKLDDVAVDERTVPKLIFNLYKKKVQPTVKISGLAVKDKKYDGSLFAELDLSNILLEGVKAGDDVSIHVSEVILRFKDASPGKNKDVIINGLLKLTGGDANKYQLEQPIFSGLTATISPLVVQISGIAVKNKKYDGVLDAELDLDNIILEGIKTGDNVNIDASDIILKFDNASSGKDKPITITGLFKLTGADAGNYQLAQPTLTGLIATISPLAVKISGVAVKNKKYDGLLDAELDLDNILLEGVKTGDNVNIDASDIILKFEDASSGKDKPVTITGLFKLTGADANNYQLEQQALTGLTATIEEAEEAKVFIDDDEINILDGKAYYLVAQNDTRNKLSIRVEGSPTVLPSDVDISKPGLNSITFSDNNGIAHILTIEKRFAFDDIVSVKWGHMFIINNNNANNGGYKFTNYKWIKNDATLPVGIKQYYREYETTKVKLRVEMTTEGGDILRTWPKEIEASPLKVTVYPNPVTAGEVVNIDAQNMPEEFFNKASLRVYNVIGTEMRSQKKIKDKITSLEMPTASGVYFIKVTDDMYEETFKIIVK